MTLIKVVFLTVILASLAGGAFGAEKKRKQTGTDLSFEDLLVQGRYHFSNESVVTVEEDKAFSKLLKIRKNFDDRVKDSADQN